MSGPVLLTGAGGYVGGRVALALTKGGSALRLATRNAAVLREQFPDAEYVARPELSQPALLESMCHGASVVIHCAAMNEIDSGKDPVGASLANTQLSVELLRAAVAAKVERFIYLSTAHVYGAPLQGTLTESSLPRPGHPYATTHLAAEHHVLSAHDRGALTGVVLRLSNSVGAPLRGDVDRWSLIANDLCRQAVTTDTLTLKSSGSALRDFIPMRDVCAAVAHVASLPRAALGDGLFNLGEGRSRSVLALTELIAARAEHALGKRPPIVRPSGEGEASPLPLDFRVDKLRATGFTLQGNLETEIDETLALCRRAFERAA